MRHGTPRDGIDGTARGEVLTLRRTGADARVMRISRRLLTVSITLALVAGVAPAAGAAAGQSSSGGHHIVRSGDTVESIARRHGVDPDQIRRANGIVDDKLYAGARLRLTPAAGTGSSSSSSSSGSASGSYRVREGDALERIARRQGVSLSALLGANGLQRSSVIHPGQRLTIPGSSSGSASSGSASGSYRVREGDALERIARRQGVSLSALLGANGLQRSSVIHPGQRLTIPGSSSASSGPGSSSSSGSAAVVGGPRVVCPVPGGRFMNDWGFPRGGGRYHQGTDLFASKGATIVAPISGTLRVGSNRLGGTTFTITSPSGWVAYGAHLDSVTRSSGTVSAGTAIGTVGDSGNAKGGEPHLHLGLRLGGGAWVNPYPSLSAAC